MKSVEKPPWGESVSCFDYMIEFPPKPTVSMHTFMNMTMTQLSVPSELDILADREGPVTAGVYRLS